MARPWEKYQSAAPAPQPAAPVGGKPWEKYAAPQRAAQPNITPFGGTGEFDPRAFAGLQTPEHKPMSAQRAAADPNLSMINPEARSAVQTLNERQSDFPQTWPKGVAPPPAPPTGYHWVDRERENPLSAVGGMGLQLQRVGGSMLPDERDRYNAETTEGERVAKAKEALGRDVASYGPNGPPADVWHALLKRHGLEKQFPDSEPLIGRAAVNAFNTAVPGTINTLIELNNESVRQAKGGIWGDRPTQRQLEQQSEPGYELRALFADSRPDVAQPEDDSRSLPMVPQIPLEPAKNPVEQGADLLGQIGGYAAGPGKFVDAGFKAAGAAMRGVGPIGRAVTAITPQGAGALDKAARYGGHLVGMIPEGVIQAGSFGAVTAPPGQAIDTAVQYASDPINAFAPAALSLINRASIFLKTMGARATPKAVELGRAVETLKRGNATPEQRQAAAATINRIAPEPQAPPVTSVPPTSPRQRPPVGATAQAAPQPSVAPAAPPVVTQAAQQVGGPPIPPQPPANALAQPPAPRPTPQAAPPPGTLTPVGNGFAVDSFNNLPVKTREGIFRAMEASGMSRQQAMDAIRSLNDLPPERANQFEFELIRRFGGPDKFPNLQANLTAMGSDFSIQPGKKGGNPQDVMNKSLLEQSQSEGEYLTRMAENIFGEGKVATKAELEEFRTRLGGQYRDQLKQTYPGLSLKRNPAIKQAERGRIDAARTQLTNYLLRPDVIENVPPWVQDQVMLQVSNDLRWLEFDDAGKRFIPADHPELAPLFTPDRELVYSPKLWRTLVEYHPTQVAHSLQSAYRAAIDTAMHGTDAAARTTAKRLMRMRGQSRVRANAANPDQRGFGLLHLLEEASPGYKKIRQGYGDVVGAQKAADMPDSFFRIAKDEEALADFKDVYDNELTPLQQDAVRNGLTTQIRQALKNKTGFTQPWEVDAAARGHLPNLTAISSQSFLEALPKVFGRDGERMADAITLSRANIDNVGNINSAFRSGTPKGLSITEDAKNLYEHPAATKINPVDNLATTLGSVGLGTAFVPGGQMVSAGLVAGALGRTLYRAYKRGKSLSPAQKEALAEWLFKPRRATDAAPPTKPRGFSKAGYAGNVLAGTAAGATVGAASSGGDPGTTLEGAFIGAFGGAGRAKLRSMRANASIIKPQDSPGSPRPRGGPPRTSANVLSAAAQPTLPRTPPDAMGFFPSGGKKPPAQSKLPMDEGRARDAEAINFDRSGAVLGPAEVSYFVDGNDVTIHSMRVRDAAARGQGAASKLLDALIFKADAEGKRILLTADPFGLTGGMSKPQLERWYKSRGFKPNAGRSKDFSVRATLIREPQNSTRAIPMDEGSRKRSLLQELARPGEPKRVADLLAGSPVSVTPDEAKEMLEIIRMHLRPESPSEYGKGFGFTLEELKADPSIAEHYLDYDPTKLAQFQAVLGTIRHQSGSSKLLAGMGENGTGYGVAGGAVAGGVLAPDTNSDGKVDSTERMAGAVGGAITGGVGVYGARKIGNSLSGVRPPRTKAPVGSARGAEAQGLGNASGAQPLRKIEAESPASPPAGKIELPKPKPPSIGTKGKGGGFGSGPPEEFPPAMRYALGGGAGAIGGTTVGGITGSVADLDGDGVAGTEKDINIGAASGFGIGAPIGASIAHVLRMNALAHAAKPSGMHVQKLADDIVAYQGFPNAIHAQQTTIDLLRQNSASPDRIEMAERVLAALRRRLRESDAELAGSKPTSNVTSIKPDRLPPASNGFGGSRKTTQGPPGSKKAKGPPMSKEETSIRSELKAARSAFTRQRNKHVMKDDREKIWAPYEARERRAEEALNAYLERKANRLAGRARMGDRVTATKQAVGKGVKATGNFLAAEARKNNHELPIALGVTGGAMALGVGYMMAQGADKPKEEVLAPTDPRYFFDGVKKSKELASSVQSTLSKVGFLDDKDADGIWGKRSGDALRSWMSANDKDPSQPPTKEDMIELLADAWGGEKRDGKWYYDDGDPIVFPPKTSDTYLPAGPPKRAPAYN